MKLEIKVKGSAVEAKQAIATEIQKARGIHPEAHGTLSSLRDQLHVAVAKAGPDETVEVSATITIEVAVGKAKPDPGKPKKVEKVETT